jgi:hypothetical protein
MFDQTKTMSFIFNKVSGFLIEAVASPFKSIVSFTSNAPNEIKSFFDFLRDAFDFKSPQIETMATQTADQLEKLGNSVEKLQNGVTAGTKAAIQAAANATGIQIAADAPPVATATPRGAPAAAAAKAK